MCVGVGGTGKYKSRSSSSCLPSFPVACILIPDVWLKLYRVVPKVKFEAEKVDVWLHSLFRTWVILSGENQNVHVQNRILQIGPEMAKLLHPTVKRKLSGHPSFLHWGSTPKNGLLDQNGAYFEHILHGLSDKRQAYHPGAWSSAQIASFVFSWKQFGEKTEETCVQREKDSAESGPHF